MVADKIREGKGGLVVDTPIKLKVAQGHAKGIQISIATYKRHARIPQVNQKPDPRNSGHWSSCCLLGALSYYYYEKILHKREAPHLAF